MYHLLFKIQEKLSCLKQITSKYFNKSIFSSIITAWAHKSKIYLSNISCEYQNSSWKYNIFFLISQKMSIKQAENEASITPSQLLKTNTSQSIPFVVLGSNVRNIKFAIEVNKMSSPGKQNL